MLAFFQRKLVFVGQSFARNVPLRADSVPFTTDGLRDTQVTMADGTVLNGWIALAEGSTRPDAEALGGRPLVVYFGGNAGTRKFRLSSLQMLTELGLNVLIVDYRSYADNTGRPSEAGFVRDGRAIVEYARTTLGVPIGRIIICGESLGGGVATAVAAQLCEEDLVPAALILRATFASLVETAAYHYPFLPVRLLLIDRFPSEDRIGRVRCPILQLHGDDDVVVPYSHGRRLFEAAPATSDNGIAKTWVTLEGVGHNNVMHLAADRVSLAIATFLETTHLAVPNELLDEATAGDAPEPATEQSVEQSPAPTQRTD